METLIFPDPADVSSGTDSLLSLPGTMTLTLLDDVIPVYLLTALSVYAQNIGSRPLFLRTVFTWARPPLPAPGRTSISADTFPRPKAFNMANIKIRPAAHARAVPNAAPPLSVAPIANIKITAMDAVLPMFCSDNSCYALRIISAASSASLTSTLPTTSDNTCSGVYSFSLALEFSTSLWAKTSFMTWRMSWGTT